MLKLNLGCGAFPLQGYENLDRKNGDEIYPLEYATGSADEIRASHVLEHFGHRDTQHIIAEWVRVLKPGGILKIAVPDFEKIAQRYLDGKQQPTEGYLMGGQVDADDYHHALFDREQLESALRDAGLDSIQEWRDSDEDCSGLDISLNLQGTKPKSDQQPLPIPVAMRERVLERAKTIGAAMSTPRLGFMDNFFCSFSQLVPIGIELRKHTGAYWGQCLERCIEEWIADGKEWVLAMDYDTLYTRADVESLIRLSIEHEYADAIAPLQASRTKGTPLMTVRGLDGNNLAEVERDFFAPPLSQVATAHFGLTLLRVAGLKRMRKPWFWDRPAGDGTWGEGRTDADIAFWRNWEQSGLSLYLANHIAVGHAELMIRWPGPDLDAIYQHPADFWASGKPDDVWR